MMVILLMIYTRVAALLLDLVINISVTLVLRIHNLLVGLLDFVDLPLVLNELTALLSQRLSRLLIKLPGFLLGMRVEEWLHLVLMMVQLEFLLAHVNVAHSELFKLLIRFLLLPIHIMLLLDKRLFVLPVAIVLLRSLVELLMTFFLVSISLMRLSVVRVLVVMWRLAMRPVIITVMLGLIFHLHMVLIPILKLFEVLFRSPDLFFSFQVSLTI